MKTVGAAAKLLQDCQTGLREILEEDRTSEIKINLNRLETFQSDPTKCRVLYAEPEKGSEGVETLHALAGRRRVCLTIERDGVADISTHSLCPRAFPSRRNAIRLQTASHGMSDFRTHVARQERLTTRQLSSTRR